ncbi:MAG: glycoside hydrolase family 3 N-terminal domain-containing protein [Pseudomonadota bacterium]
MKVAPRRIIVGLAGTQLSADERCFLKAETPAGVILFRRNLVSAEQTRALIRDVRACLAEVTPLILVDEEGGRVQRLRPPLGRRLPAAATYLKWGQSLSGAASGAGGAVADGAVAAGPAVAAGAAAAAGAAEAVARLTAYDLHALGFNTNCAPVVDLRFDGAHEIVGDRAYGEDVSVVAMLARAVCDGLTAGGVLPVVKHIPGHGRAACDSHLALPVIDVPHVDLTTYDFAAFKMLADQPTAMTAHAVYSAYDQDRPATTSPTIMHDVVRDAIGFDGLVMTDDVCMRALDGSIASRCRDAIAAGCDLVLHCSGDLAGMQEAAAAVPRAEGDSARRLATALQITDADPRAFDKAAVEETLETLLAFEDALRPGGAPGAAERAGQGSDTSAGAGAYPATDLVRNDPTEPFA